MHATSLGMSGADRPLSVLAQFCAVFAVRWYWLSTGSASAHSAGRCLVGGTCQREGVDGEGTGTPTTPVMKSTWVICAAEPQHSAVP
jgi:hypothetical protein